MRNIQTKKRHIIVRSKLKDGLGSKRKNLFQENGQNNPNEFILSLSKGIPLDELTELINDILRVYAEPVEVMKKNKTSSA